MANTLRRPFRTPFIQKTPILIDNSEAENRPAKKRRLHTEVEGELSENSYGFAKDSILYVPQKGSLPIVPNHNIPNEGSRGLAETRESYYNALYRKLSTKKHRNWDGDGILWVSGGYAYLKDISGKEMGRVTCDRPLLPGSSLSIGGKEVEVNSLMSKSEYIAMTANLKPIVPVVVPAKMLTPVAKPENLSKQNPRPSANTKSTPRSKVIINEEDDKTVVIKPAPVTHASQAQYKNPMLASSAAPKKHAFTPTPRYDPMAPDAVVMKRPKAAPKGKQIVDVVIDPLLTKRLRPHQREGVKFLYECVMGLRYFEGKGAILADEMGLGKTLQTIALIWTLLKQNPIYEEQPVIKKALIVCPVTLINNWRKEIRKWLGNERLGVFVADGNKRLTDFTMGKSYSIMIIGYEKLRNVQEDLKKGAGIDIVIADEGHRLKTAQNKSALAIRSLNTAKRIILSGTPIQNDLGEFFMMVDFVNPGLLDTYKKFMKEFDVPINKSRQPNATEKEIEQGEEKSEELSALTTPFILRRTADILSDYLPSKTEYVVLCRPTAAQGSVYQQVLASPMFQSALGNAESSLQLLTVLRKVCNSPKLLQAAASDEREPSALTESLLSTIPAKLLSVGAHSTKVRVLDQLLHTISTQTEEKVVIVSNFTSTLNLLANLLSSLSLPFSRLDGSTPASKRQGLVDAFNNSPASNNFAFLLSAKAGGMGINLVGASRLILFDIDWNPAIDLQAMARIHRYGQKRPCVIYRFLMAGGLDEKIWQRQVAKLGLANSVMEKKSGVSAFSREELRDLFRLDGRDEGCLTHDLIGCSCTGSGEKVDSPIDPTKLLEIEKKLGATDAVEFGDENGEDLPDFNKMLENSTSTWKPSKSTSFSDSEDEDDVPLVRPRATLIKASELPLTSSSSSDPQTPTTSISLSSGIQTPNNVASDKRKDQMQSLMTYIHIDTSKFATQNDESKEAKVEDEILRMVLKEEGNRVGFLFAKRTS